MEPSSMLYKIVVIILTIIGFFSLCFLGISLGLALEMVLEKGGLVAFAFFSTIIIFFLPCTMRIAVIGKAEPVMSGLQGSVLWGVAFLVGFWGCFLIVPHNIIVATMIILLISIVDLPGKGK